MTGSRLALITCCLTLAALCGGCYGFGVDANITPLHGGSYSAHSRAVKILFGTPARAPHVQLAHIEVVGTAGMSTAELMSKMEQEAQDVGADAVVAASQDYRTREAGNVLLDILMVAGCVASRGPCHIQDTRYEAPVLRGVAVKYVQRPRRVAARSSRPARRAAPAKKPPAAQAAARSGGPVVALGRVSSMSAVPGPEVTASLTAHLKRRLKAAGVTVARVGARKSDRTIAASIQQADGRCVLRMSVYDNREGRVSHRLKQAGSCSEAALRASVDSMTGKLALVKPAHKKNAAPDEPWAARQRPVASLEDHPRAPY